MSKSLLIIGAGGHGQVVYEVAVDCGYCKIAFIDDNSERAVGKVSDIEKYKGQYTHAFVSIGDNKLREYLISKIKKMGFNVPILIHPSAYISRTCVIKEGTIVEPKAIVNAHSFIDEGSIISTGAIIDHDVIIGKYCHINSGAILKAGTQIGNYKKLEAGEVISGYETARTKSEEEECAHGYGNNRTNSRHYSSC